MSEDRGDFGQESSNCHWNWGILGQSLLRSLEFKEAQKLDPVSPGVPGFTNKEGDS